MTEAPGYGQCGVSEPLRRIFFELLETCETHPVRVRYLGDLNDVHRLWKLTPQGAIEKRGKLLGPFRGTARIDLEIQTGRRILILYHSSIF